MADAQIGEAICDCRSISEAKAGNEAFNGGEVRVATLLRQFPVALVTREDKGS